MRGAGERVKFRFGDEAALAVVSVGEARAAGQGHRGLPAAVPAPNGGRHAPRKVRLLDDVSFNVVLIDDSVDEAPRAVEEDLLSAFDDIADTIVENILARGLSRDRLGGLFVQEGHRLLQEGHRLLPRFPIQGVGVTLHVLEAS